MFKNSEHLHQIIAKYLAGELNQEDMVLLNQWRASNDENERRLQAYKNTWKTMDPGSSEQPFDKQRGWQLLQKMLAKRATQESADVNLVSFQSRKVTTNRRSWVLGVAALLSLGLLGVFWLVNKQSTVQMDMAIAGVEERKTILLPDGSTVVLNSGSQVRWVKDFGNQKRDVILQGQAFFKVKKDRVPFKVTTSKSEIVVLGTEFDVWARNRKTRVLLSSGKLAVTHLQTGQRQILNPNQVIELGADLFQLSDHDSVLSFLGWQENRLVFKAQPLRDVVEELEHWFGVKIQLAQPSLEQLLVTGSFQDPQLAGVLSEISLALNITLEQVGRDYVISP